MLRIFSRNRLLFTVYSIFFLFSISLLAFLGKKETHLLLTQWHPDGMNSLMRIITFLGDGAFMAALGLGLLFYRLRYGLTIISSFLFSTILVQVLKRLVFPGCFRPVSWFHKLGIEIYRVPGLEYHSAFSFPSGHSTTAFALFIGLALFTRNTGLKVILLILAIVTAYSRVYLSQHFLGDALAGSLLGVASACLMQYVFENWRPAWMEVNSVIQIWKK